MSRFVHEPTCTEAERASLAAVLAETAIRCASWPAVGAIFTRWSGAVGNGEPLTARLGRIERSELAGVCRATLGRYPSLVPLQRLRDALDVDGSSEPAQYVPEPEPGDDDVVTSTLWRAGVAS